MKKQNLNIRVDSDLYEKVKSQAESEGVSSSEFMRRAIVQKLSTNGSNESEQNVEWYKNKIDELTEFSTNERKMHHTQLMEFQAQIKALYEKLESKEKLIEAKPKTIWQRLSAVFN